MPGTYHGRGSKGEPKSAGRELRYPERRNSRDPENMILAALSQKEHRFLREYLEFVPLRYGAVLWEANQPIEFVYFPTAGMVSFVAVMSNGATVEVGTTGVEGFVGTAVVLGARDVPFSAITTAAGEGFRIEAGLLRRILPQVPQLEQLLCRYAHSHAMQVAQAAACNCLHHVPERLARWLALTCDRLGSDLLPMTQEFLAEMLGCRRSSVTSAVAQLQKVGVIRSGRGQLRVLDRKQLEKRACECYSILRKLSDVSYAS